MSCIDVWLYCCCWIYLVKWFEPTSMNFEDIYLFFKIWLLKVCQSLKFVHVLNHHFRIVKQHFLLFLFESFGRFPLGILLHCLICCMGRLGVFPISIFHSFGQHIIFVNVNNGRALTLYNVHSNLYSLPFEVLICPKNVMGRANIHTSRAYSVLRTIKVN